MSARRPQLHFRSPFRSGAWTALGFILAGTVVAEQPAAPAAPQGDDGQASSMPDYVVEVYRLPEPRISPIESMRISVYLQLRMEFGWPGLGGAYVMSPLRVPQRITFCPAPVEVLPGRALENRLAATHGMGPASMFSGPLLVPPRSPPPLLVWDGIPQRDPFSSWFDAREIPSLGIARVEQIHGGGASAWGDGCVDGMVQVLSASAVGRAVTVPAETIGGGPDQPQLTKQRIDRTGATQITWGDGGSIRATISANEPTTRGNGQWLVDYADEDAPSSIAHAQRGPIDQPARRRAHSWQTRWRQPAGPDRELSFTWRSYHATHVQPSGLQTERLDRDTWAAGFTSARSVDFSWQTSGFVQWTRRDDTFGLPDAVRNRVLPLWQQPDSDSLTVGASAIGAWRPAGNSRVVVGLDARSTQLSATQIHLPSSQTWRGSAQEARVGVYTVSDLELSATWHGYAGARLDFSPLSDHGASIPTTQTTHLSPSAGFVWHPHDHITVRGHVQGAYREPTWAERLLVQQQRERLIEPDPTLRTETSFNGQAGVIFSPSPRWDYEVRVSHQARTDAIVPVAVDTDAPAPASNQLRWSNLPRINTDALTLRAAWHPTDSVGAVATVTWTAADARTDATAVRHRSADTPGRSATLTGHWQPLRALDLSITARYRGPRFADFENRWPLTAVTRLDLRASYTWTNETEIALSVGNLGSTEATIDRDATGTRYTTGPTRLALSVKTPW